jgi:ATP-dependent Clp protease ATP-binding subunit ClpC
MPDTLLNCAACGGTGKIGGGKCLSCHELGTGIFRDGKFLYWNKVITSQELEKKKAEKFLKLFLNGASFIFSVLATLFLLWQIVERSLFEEIFTLAFWISGDAAVILFLISLLVDAYLIYRFSEEIAQKAKIEKKEYQESGSEKKGEEIIPPSDWVAVRDLPGKVKINVADTFSFDTEKAVSDAWYIALKLNHNKVLLPHLFIALLFSKKAAIVFGRLGVNLKELQEKLGRQLSASGEPLSEGAEPVFSEELIQLFFESYNEAYSAKREQIDIAELLLVISRSNPFIQELLYEYEVDLDKLKNVVEWLRISEFLRKRWQKGRSLARLKPGGTMSRAMTAVATPYLDRFSQDFTMMAKYGHFAPCLGREKEIEEIFRIIEGGRQSVILVGNPGTGKSAIIEGIAQRMVEEDVPKILQDQRLVSLNIGQLVAGATPSEAQERLLIICNEIARSGNIVLCVQDIEGIIGITSGDKESIDLGRVLADELSQGYFFAIASARSGVYSQHIENSPLGAVLQKVMIEEPDTNGAIQILEGKAGVIEYQNKVVFSYDAISKAVTLSGRYLHDRYLPEKAIEIMREVAHFAASKRGAGTIVTGEDVAEVIAGKTKIPVTAVSEAESEKLLRLEDEMHKRVIGQEEAIKMIAAALRRARAEIREVKRPIANFLFLGPTGVGKTETAKTVAEVYFGDEKNMIRLDMSEYQDQASIYRLIGAPGGSSSGFLTEAIRKSPFALLLLDEIEKAHPDILNIFLQVMDDGRLTDNLGRTIDFTNVILIATSNAGSPAIQDGIKQGLAIDAIKEQLINVELKPHFRPEFLNRFDGIVVYRPLTEPEIERIAGLMLAKIGKQLENKRGIILEAKDEAIKELAAIGFDPAFGARPLRRVIQEKVEDALTNMLLTKQVARRDKIILEAGGNMRVEKGRIL